MIGSVLHWLFVFPPTEPNIWNFLSFFRIMFTYGFFLILGPITLGWWIEHDFPHDTVGDYLAAAFGIAFGTFIMAFILGGLAACVGIGKLWKTPVAKIRLPRKVCEYCHTPECVKHGLTKGVWQK